MLRPARNLAIIGLSVMLTGAFAGCSKKPPVQVMPNADSLAAARAKARQDSIDAALAKARQDSITAAEAAAKAAAEAAAAAKAAQAFTLSDVYFDFDKSNLRSDAQTTMSGNAALLSQHPQASVTVEGNCDERGSNEYNLALGERRAEAAKTYLVNYGIDAGRITTVSYGEERPVDPGHNEAAWAKNRHDHFEVKQ